MANAPVGSLRSVMRLTNGTFASIERHFPNLSVAAENAPVPMWPDMLGLVDGPDSGRDRIYPWEAPIHLRMLGIANRSDDELNGGPQSSGPSIAADPERGISASGTASLQSLFSHLWDEHEESPRNLDAERPSSPLSVGGDEPNEAEDIGGFGAIGGPVFPEGDGDDWSDVGSEFDDDYDSDYYYDSGFDTGSEVDSNSESGSDSEVED